MPLLLILAASACRAGCGLAGARRFSRLQRHAESGRRRHRLSRQGRLDHRRLVACRRLDLQDADRRAAVIAILLSLCRRRRARRALGRPDQHVRGRKRVQDRRRQRLLRPWLPARRLPGIRHGRAGELDGPADRRARNGTALPAVTGQTLNETQPQGQDPRHARTGLLRHEDDAEETVRGRRRRLPHQHEPHRPRLDARRWSRRIRTVEEASSAGRSAFSPTCRGRSCASASSPTARSR